MKWGQFVELLRTSDGVSRPHQVWNDLWLTEDVEAVEQCNDIERGLHQLAGEAGENQDQMALAGLIATAQEKLRGKRSTIDLIGLESAVVELRARLFDCLLIIDHAGGSDIRTDPPELSSQFLNSLIEAHKISDALHEIVHGEPPAKSPLDRDIQPIIDRKHAPAGRTCSTNTFRVK